MTKKKMIEGGKKKVSKKRKAIQRWKYIKDIYAELDEIKKRLDNVEGELIKMVKEKNE